MINIIAPHIRFTEILSFTGAWTLFHRPCSAFKHFPRAWRTQFVSHHQ